jgi:hypothetical protein
MGSAPALQKESLAELHLPWQALNGAEPMRMRILSYWRVFAPFPKSGTNIGQKSALRILRVDIALPLTVPNRANVDGNSGSVASLVF